MKFILLLLLVCSSAFAETKALIKRGITEIPIDLADATAKSKIKDYDVILLGEGVYTTLGDFSAKYVRVIGKGPQKTFISSTKNSSLIPVNSTEFWDLSIKDAKFRLSDVNGVWAVNVEFSGSIFMTPAALDKYPAFFVRSVFSDLSKSDLPSGGLYTHLQGKTTATDLIELEKQLDQSSDSHLKNRMTFKGIIARGLNYLYHKGKHNPEYDKAKFIELTKKAQEAKAKGHTYASMIIWAEADYLSGHTRFDEVLREITPMSQKVSQEGGCTVEGQALKESLFVKVPVTSLPGPCRIQAFQVNSFGKENKETLISAARRQHLMNKAEAFRDGPASDDEFAVGAPLILATQYTLVTDLDIQGFRKSYASDVDTKVQGNSIVQNIVDPIAKAFKEKFATKIKAATTKMASTDFSAKFDGFIVSALYGDDPSKQSEYETLHEQQFGRKLSPTGAMSSAFAY